MDTRPPAQLGIYISIPFCRSKCAYCNFASGVYPASEHTRYVERIEAEIGAARAWAGSMGVELPERIDSIYLGGGTPSLLSSDLLARVFAALRGEFAIEPTAEVTVECAPGQLSDDAPESRAACGVYRISLGVQSFVGSELALSGRLHARAAAELDVARLRKAGIRNLNLDLIAGLATQTPASWSESLDALLALRPPHASVYMLEVDEDSRLGREMLSGGARYHADEVPCDEAIADMYLQAIERFDAAGLKQYEISNFARYGKQSRHNLRYWRRWPYIGFGLDASSALFSTGDAPRYLLRSNATADLKAYLEAAEPAETAWLSPARQFEEAWFLGLRTNRGVRWSALKKEFGAAPAEAARPVVRELAEEGLLTDSGRAVALTPKGRLLSNEVFERFLGLCEPHEQA